MQRLLPLIVISFLSLAVQAAPGKLLRDENLRADAAMGARVLALLARGDTVETLERQGGWLRVGTPQGDGWVRLLSVRGDVAAQGAPLAELKAELLPGARPVETRVVAVAGFRGGEDDEQIEAAGRAALEKLESYRLAASPEAVPGRTRLASRVDAACGAPALPAAARATPSGGARLSLMSAWLLDRMSAEDEAKIGRALAVRLLSTLPVVDDPGLQGYLNQAGRRLVAALGGQANQPWLFAVLDSEEIYAYSAPGGYVFITRGLYRLLHDEAELAVVLAREIAHLSDQRLLLDLRQNASNSGRPRDEADFLRQLLGNGLDALIRPFSVESEYAADREAVLLTARAGYDPYALAAFLQSLGGVPEGDPRLTLLSRSQPRADARLERLSRTLETCLAGLPPGRRLEAALYRIN
ncbi:MAG: M48 family metalloprotease [Gallionellaceae bacterium]|nr:M48 family metalloprotease [Gallionellaceae bacterium]